MWLYFIYLNDQFCPPLIKTPVNFVCFTQYVIPYIKRDYLNFHPIFFFPVFFSYKNEIFFCTVVLPLMMLNPTQYLFYFFDPHTGISMKDARISTLSVFTNWKIPLSLFSRYANFSYILCIRHISIFNMSYIMLYIRVSRFIKINEIIKVYLLIASLCIKLSAVLEFQYKCFKKFPPKDFLAHSNVINIQVESWKASRKINKMG